MMEVDEEFKDTDMSISENNIPDTEYIFFFNINEINEVNKSLLYELKNMNQNCFKTGFYMEEKSILCVNLDFKQTIRSFFIVKMDNNILRVYSLCGKEIRGNNTKVFIYETLKYLIDLNNNIDMIWVGIDFSNENLHKLIIYYTSLGFSILNSKVDIDNNGFRYISMHMYVSDFKEIFLQRYQKNIGFFEGNIFQNNFISFDEHFKKNINFLSYLNESENIKNYFIPRNYLFFLRENFQQVGRCLNVKNDEIVREVGGFFRANNLQEKINGYTYTKLELVNLFNTNTESRMMVRSFFNVKYFFHVHHSYCYEITNRKYGGPSGEDISALIMTHLSEPGFKINFLIAEEGVYAYWCSFFLSKFLSFIHNIPDEIEKLLSFNKSMANQVNEYSKALDIQHIKKVTKWIESLKYEEKQLVHVLFRKWADIDIYNGFFIHNATTLWKDEIQAGLNFEMYKNEKLISLEESCSRKYKEVQGDTIYFRCE